MAQGSYILRNVSAQSTEECVPNYLGIDYSYQSNLDYLNCVDSFRKGSTIKRLSLKKRPRVAVNNVEKTQSGISSSQWHSAESLSSPGSDDTRLLGMSSTTRGRPPLPPPHGSSLDNKHTRNEGPATSPILNETKPQPAARSLQRQSPVVEKTIMETLKHLDQEVTSQPPPQPHPRRRLASFGGVSSHGSLSPFTGLGAYNQNNNGNRPTGTGSDIHLNLTSSLGSRGSTGCLRLSPQSSGRTTPVTGLGPTHLQQVRDQMVVALQRLKELEEQVTIIPILQVKISVLQEEKRQLISQLKKHGDNEDINDEIWKRAYCMEKSDMENKVNTEEKLEGIVKSDCTSLREFRQLTEEMQALERTIKGRQLQAWHGTGPLHDKAIKSAAVGTDKDIHITLSKSTKENKYVYTDQVETRSIATEVSEVNLGIYTEREAELDAQQLIIGALKERICHLETELKESALQTEMSRLKLELQAAGARNRADKASFARPTTVSTGIDVRPHTTSQGVGNHTELRDASTGEVTEVKTVGVSCCGPELKNVCTGPDVPMSHWEVRERVETMEKGVGIQVSTNTQGVGVEIKLCDAETNTEVLVESLESKKGQMKYKSVGCGDCSVDVIICEAKEVVSQGIATDQVRGVDLGVMASPQTASQRTNTVNSSVSRFTNTRHAFNTDSSTNTILSTQDKHTNTIQTVTRTVSVGNRVKDIKCTPETCTIGVGTADLSGSALKQTPVTVPKVTRDAGVGFTNINENFLVGLKTRNMASGPSHLPDPIKTRSIGVGEGRIRDLSVSSSKPGQMIQQSVQSQWDPGLNHYIEKMHWLLREHGDLLTEDNTQGKEGFVHQHNSQGSASSKLSCNNKFAAQGGTEVHPFDSQSPVSREFQSPSQPLVDSSECDKSIPEICHQGGHDSEVKRMIQMLEQQASSALQDRSTKAGVLRSVMKKQNGDQGCSSNRKSMKFMRVTTGLDPMSSYELSANEKANSEEVEKRGNKKSRDASQDGLQGRKGKGCSNKGSKGAAKPHTQRYKLSEKMFSACQALKMHLSDDTALSSRELHDCLQTLQQEWFSVSSHKSATADTMRDYLSTVRVISPLVLQHVVNMADGNGNTALHYSVSHSNFGIVKKLLDAEVCNVNQQNKAGYTPIMLAALAAVESPEDMRVVEQLFTKGDVNAKASQAGQTALMLAVSHGRMDMVQALLAQGAEVNLQDDEGSTALMCASEHGHADIVRLLLAQPDCDATLTDSDESTALSIALEAGHNDIAVLLYAHATFSKGQTGAAARHSGKSLSSPGGRNIPE
ncbi:KN motif and ankyrin repeat domain-containing protein 1-like [Plectropomus leopardus]|uniref:KN motif and ankyrin repeat domain-containing protein 1-like n=1 Tax=Plectropomus leopardus TaxID=160734 RepID=UPI001C4C19A2|nr:KN motif and ankyrin repeat domain-containing protein 1-like [Plectropomus leopardus]